MRVVTDCRYLREALSTPSCKLPRVIYPRNICVSGMRSFVSSHCFSVAHIHIYLYIRSACNEGGSFLDNFFVLGHIHFRGIYFCMLVHSSPAEWHSCRFRHAANSTTPTYGVVCCAVAGVVDVGFASVVICFGLVIAAAAVPLFASAAVVVGAVAGVVLSVLVLSSAVPL